MTTWERICRICSSKGDYELFAKIPTYLHANANEFLDWQKPINVMIEETTGLKVSKDDGLPRSICAVCISYLKHAVTFRQQTINNAMTLKAIQLLRQQTTKKDNKVKVQSDKDSLLISEQQLAYSDDRQCDTNLLMNNYQQDQNKVQKQVFNNNFQQPSAVVQQNVEVQLRYLNLLFNKDNNKKFKGINTSTLGSGSGGDAYFEEEDFQTTTSSEDNENQLRSQKHNMFSYTEKNFEEDDIMNLDALRNAVSINIPETCKERKCRACFRRFMFEESYNEHMDICIEYKFVVLIEELNRLLHIRRSKAVSPHEFIRRFIFCLRKTCDWLKINCKDMLLPELTQTGINNNKQIIESDSKHSATSSGDLGKLEQQIIPDGTITTTTTTTTTVTATATELNESLSQVFSERNNVTDCLRNMTINDNLLAATTATMMVSNNDTSNNSNCYLETTDDINNLFIKPKTLLKTNNSNGELTPITFSNNILYEIERSLSRASNHNSNNLDFNNSIIEVKKPIAILATGGMNTTVNNSTSFTADNNKCNNHEDVERLTFLQKLYQAGCPSANINSMQLTTKIPTKDITTSSSSSLSQHATLYSPPLASARKDLVKSSSNTVAQTSILFNKTHTASTINTNSAPPQSNPNFAFSARCSPCGVYFNSISSLEKHNAMQHNHKQQQKNTTIDPNIDEERKKIIALFDDDDDDDNNQN